MTHAELAAGAALANLKRDNEAVEYLCRAWLAREQLEDGGAQAAELLSKMGLSPEHCE